MFSFSPWLNKDNFHSWDRRGLRQRACRPYRTMIVDCSQHRHHTWTFADWLSDNREVDDEDVDELDDDDDDDADSNDKSAFCVPLICPPLSSFYR